MEEERLIDPDSEGRILEAVDSLEALRNSYRSQYRLRFVIVIVALCVAVLAIFLGFRRGNAFCKAGNEFKNADTAKWEYVLDLTKNQPRTAEIQKQRDQFIAYLKTVNKTKECGLTL